MDIIRLRKKFKPLPPNFIFHKLVTLEIIGKRYWERSVSETGKFRVMNLTEFK